VLATGHVSFIDGEAAVQDAAESTEQVLVILTRRNNAVGQLSL
jgi:hypothetical protein